MAETLSCARCGETNPADARFCIGCGELVATQATTGPTMKLKGIACPACGAVSPEESVFCASCGRVVGEPRVQPAPQPTYPGARQAPRPVYPPRIYPRVNTPPTIVPSQRQQQSQTQHTNWTPLIAVAAVLFLVMNMSGMRSGFPFFLFFFLPLGLLRRHSGTRNFAPAFWMLGLVVLFATKAFWPGILVLLALWMLFGR